MVHLSSDTNTFLFSGRALDDGYRVLPSVFYLTYSLYMEIPKHLVGCFFTRDVKNWVEIRNSEGNFIDFIIPCCICIEDVGQLHEICSMPALSSKFTDNEGREFTYNTIREEEEDGETCSNNTQTEG